MNGPTHLAVGIAAGMAAAPPGDWKSLAIAGAVGGLAGLLPDWLQINLPGVNKHVKGVTGHRGFSHWAWTALAVGYIPVLAERPFYAFPALSGYFSHIVLDLLAGGCFALWPLGRITLARIKCGSWMDEAFGAAGLLLIVAQIARRLL